MPRLLLLALTPERGLTLHALAREAGFDPLLASLPPTTAQLEGSLAALCDEDVPGALVRDLRRRLPVARGAHHSAPEVARAVWKALAQTRAQASAERWGALQEFSLALERAESAGDLARLAAQALTRLTAFEAAMVLERRGHSLVSVAFDPPQLLKGEAPFTLDAARHPTLRALFAGPGMVVIKEYAAFQDTVPSAVQAGLRSVTLMPSVVEGSVRAVLAVGSFRARRAPGAQEVRVLEFVAARLANALQRVEDAARLRRRLTALHATSQVAETLRPLMSTAAVYKAIGDLALRAAQASIVSVFLHDAATDTLRVTYSVGEESDSMAGVVLARGEGFSWRAFDSGEPFFTADALRESGVAWRGAAAEGFGVLVVPLTNVAGRPIGVLVAGADAEQHRFSDADMALLTALAHAAGAQLYRLEVAEQAERERAAYRALADFGSRIEEQHDLESLLDLGVEFATLHLGLEFAGCYDVDGEWLRLRRLHNAAPGAEAPRLPERHPVRGLMGEVVRSAEIRFTADDGNSPWVDERTRASGLRTLIGVPVRRSGRVAHVFFAGTREKSVVLGGEQLAVVRGFVRRIEHALERTDHLREVVAAREASLRALGLALEHRDFETAGHTDRVVALAQRFGAWLGLGDAEQEALRWGAYLHDIGKMALPDAVLLKPASLERAEFELVKQHASVGHALCREISFLPEGTRAVVRSHHERWDGHGYPDGLSGLAVPYLARLFSLIDVYDALVSVRPYKPAWSAKDALAELARSAGTQFDPQLVAAFLAMQQAAQAVYEEQKI